MRIFLSYASEEEVLANQIRLKLEDAGYDVFFSAASIRASDGYDERIRNEMAKADRLLFLASPASLDKGCYTQTELALAERRWPKPKRHVMAVMVEGIGPGDLPPYLGAVSSASQPKGDPAAHVTATVLERWPKTIRRFLKPAILTLVVATFLGLAALWYSEREGRKADEQGRIAEEEALSNAKPRLTPSQFRLALAEFRVDESKELATESAKMMKGLGKLIAAYQMIPPPIAPPPTDLPDKQSVRLERLAYWAYPQGETPEERVAARRKLLSEKFLRSIAVMMSGEKFTVASKIAFLEANRAPGSDESLLDWYVRMWTRLLDPKDPFDLREGNRMLTGTPHEDRPHDWPPEPNPRLHVQIRMLESMGNDDHFAKSVILTSAVAGRLKREGWEAPHPVGATFDATLEVAAESARTRWRLARPEADQYLISEYDRQYKEP